MMRQTPLGHDAATPGHNAGHASCRERNKTEQNAGVNGEVIHALFRLFDQRIAEDFPSEFFGFAAHLFQRLVDRNGANRNR